MRGRSVTIVSFQLYPLIWRGDHWMTPRGQIVGFQEY